MSQKIYISGPITGHADFEKNFKKAEEKLRAEGYQVVNPAELPHEHAQTWAAYMHESLRAQLTCSCIYMLVGWPESRGATIEHQLAADLGYKIIYQSRGE